MRSRLAMVAVLLAGCSEDPAAPQGWRSQNGAIRDPEGRTVLMRGVNLASEHKAAPYFGFHQAADFDRVAEAWGMNAVRFLISWSAVEPAPGEYDASYLDALAERMQWADEAGLLVVLDMHQDLYGEGFAGGNGAPAWTCAEEHYDAFVPAEPWFLGYSDEHMVACYDQFFGSAELRASYAAAWRSVAARLAAERAVVGFDIMNEPYWGSAAPSTFEGGALTSLYEEVVAAVRAEAPGWIAFVEPSSSRNLGVPTAIGPFGFDNLVYAPHSYDTAAEQGDGFDPAGRNGLILKLGAMREEAAALGAALWIGEYGGSADAPGITEYMDAQYDGSATALASSIYWAYDRDDGYGLLRPDGSDKPELLDAVVRPFPARAAGALVSFEYDEATRSLTISYQPDESIAAPTIISVPERVYPDGYQVICDGCAHQARAGWLEITTPPQGAPAIVTIQP